jgi:adenylate cyclase
LWLSIGIGLLTWTLLMVVRLWGGMQALELKSYDLLLRWRPPEVVDPHIVLIGETEPDIRRFGHPLPDRTLADALKKLLAAKVRVVGMDKYRDVPVAPGTEDLSEVLKNHHNIVWIYYVGTDQKNFIPPPAILESSDQKGFNDVINDPDGVTRRGLLFIHEGETHHYSFPLVLALHYLAEEGITAQSGDRGHLKLGPSILRPLTDEDGAYAGIDAGGYQILLDYPGLPDTFPSYTLSELMDGQIPAEALKDKLVLIGAMAPSLVDYHLLPSGESRYGVEQHAYVVSQLLNIALGNRTPVRFWSEWGELAWLLLWCVAGGVAGYRRGGNLLFGLVTLLGLGGIVVSGALFFREGWWIPTIPPAMGWLGGLTLSVTYFSTRERGERRQLMQIFERHVSPEVAATLWDARQDFFAHGGVKPDQLTATVLFTDLAGFTSIAERMEPATLMSWLNVYMDEMSQIVIAHGGMINKYIGDAIMAVFGVPIKRTSEAEMIEDARRAVECALRMGERLQELNAVWQKEGLPSIGMRVGIHTGPLMAGSLGGRLRMEYTVIGDTVNIASRLESFDKTVAEPTEQQPCRILIGEISFQYLKEIFHCEAVGDCHLKGKQQPLKIYRVVNRLNVAKISHQSKGEF